MPSLNAVNPFMSQNRIVISRRVPVASVNSGRSISPATMRGSTYLPKVSRICALIRSSPTMLLKDWVSRPISSREVIGMTVSSAPPSTAAVPGSSRRTGRTRPSVTSGGDDDAERTGDRQQRQADRDDALLIGAGADDRGAGEPAHLAARGIDLAVEIVAPVVEIGEQSRQLPGAAGGAGGKQLVEDLFVAAPLVLQGLDPVVEPRQRDVVVEIERVGRSAG